MGPAYLPNGSLEASCIILASWMPFGAVLEASWKTLGWLQSREQVLLNGSWPLQEEFQERFPANLKARKLLKRGRVKHRVPEATPAENDKITKL